MHTNTNTYRIIIILQCSRQEDIKKKLNSKQPTYINGPPTDNIANTI